MPRTPTTTCQNDTVTEGADRDFTEVAKVVLAFLHERGYDDAVLMPDAGAGLFDVDSSKGVAEITVGSPPNRPDIQRLDGVARAEEKPALLFSVRGFTTSAIEWADNITIALFAFDGNSDDIVPVNGHAEKLLIKPPTREEAIMAAASRALAAAKEEVAEDERRKDTDPDTLARIEAAKARRAARKDLLG
jgi:hypothetical protein